MGDIVQISNERLDQIAELIEAKSREIPHAPFIMPSGIFKVHDFRRSENEEAYEPKILSIGPLHSDKPNLKQMEPYKLSYVQQRFQRGSIRLIINDAIIRELDKARWYYVEKVSLSENEFAAMLFVDGCFIIEFLRNWHSGQPRNSSEEDPPLDMPWLRNNIARDLLLFENQIPFFVLVELCRIVDLTKDDLLHLAMNLCEVMPDCRPTANYSLLKAMHLLDFVQKVCCSSFVVRPTESHDSVRDCSKWFIKSAGELHQSGITFETDTRRNHSWLDITFENGVLKIPPLTVTDNTESIFRNLIAYEEYNTNPRYRRCISDYIKFLDRLIDSPMDVEKLRFRGIIKNLLGDDEVVSTMFNKLGNAVITSEQNFSYKDVFEQVNNYACQRWNIRRKKWMTPLKEKYFNTPWSILSFSGAIVLLILTFVQTLFTILQYAKQ